MDLRQDEPRRTERQVGDEPDRLPLIFVLGAARSGTTLTARILSSHPAVLHLGETHFFESVGSSGEPDSRLAQSDLTTAARKALGLFGQYGYARGQERADASLTEAGLLDGAREAGGGLFGLYRAFAAQLAAAEGKRTFCDDTPKHAFFLEGILRNLPEAKAIVCVRDPRDYLASCKYYWRRSREPERVRAIYHPLQTSLLWRSTWQTVSEQIAAADSSRVLLNRYEALVQDPVGQVQRMCAFLGLDYRAAMLDVGPSNTSFEEGQAGVFTTSVGRYRSALCAEEIWIAQWANGAAMDSLGYVRDPVRPHGPRLVWNLLTAAPTALRGLYANRRRRGPLLPYLRRRLRALLRSASL